MALYQPTAAEMREIRETTGMGSIPAKRWLQIEELERRTAVTSTLEDLRDVLADTIEAIKRIQYGDH